MAFPNTHDDNTYTYPGVAKQVEIDDITLQSLKNYILLTHRPKDFPIFNQSSSSHPLYPPFFLTVYVYSSDKYALNTSIFPLIPTARLPKKDSIRDTVLKRFIFLILEIRK